MNDNSTGSSTTPPGIIASSPPWTGPGSRPLRTYTNPSDGMTSVAARRGTAYHEAGHVVLQCVFGYSVDYVTIEPTVEMNGHVLGDTPYLPLLGWWSLDRWTYPPGWPASYEEYLRDLHNRNVVENSIIIAMAGEIAQRQYVPSSVEPWHGDGDRMEIEKLLGCLASIIDPALQEAWRGLLELRTQRLVEEHAYRIRAVADALMVKTTLTGAEVAALVRSRLSHVDADEE